MNIRALSCSFIRNKSGPKTLSKHQKMLEFLLSPINKNDFFIFETHLRKSIAMKLIYPFLLAVVTCSVLISNQSALKAQNPNWFEEVTQDVGLDSTIGRRLYFADVNGDDYPDLVLHDNSGRSQLQLFLNVPDPNGNGRFFMDTTEWSNINKSPKSNLDGRETTNLVMGDVDNDGDKDLMSCLYYHRKENYNDRGDRCACLLNNGKGKFSLKENSGLAEIGLINATGMALLDYNQDGYIDIYISTWSKDHTNNLFDFDYLMEGNGDGTFEDVSVKAGLHFVAPYPMYGINIMDWNNDGYADAANSPYCRSGGDFWKNTGEGAFKDVSDKINYDAHTMDGDNGQTLCQWAADPSDYDNDGDIDFYLSMVHGGSGPNEGNSTMVVNHGPDSNFVTSWAPNIIEKEPPKPSHHGDFDADWVDINNDGLMDLVTGQGVYNPNEDRIYAFLQQKNNQFDEITRELDWLSKFNQPNKIQALDYDLDGDDDLMVSSYGDNSRVALLENKIGNQNNWVSVKLIPPRNVNQDAIGARVYIYADTMMHMRDVYAGEGNMGGQSPFILNFGVGDLTIDSIMVRWPNNEAPYYKVRNPQMNNVITINGEGTFGIEGTAKKEKYQVFPNPVEDVLKVKLKHAHEMEDGKIRLFTPMGKKILSRNFSQNTNQFSLNVGHLDAGWYMLQVFDDRGRSQTFKVLKK